MNARAAKALERADALGPGDSRTLESWFERRGWQPAPFQRAAWQAYREGASGLIHAPTGAGKTLALIGGPLLEALAQPPPRGCLQVLWLTPLRALAGDTLVRLQQLCDETASGTLAVARRTADSSSADRRALQKLPPWCLLTTPESLSLLLTHVDWQERLRQLKAVLVDEWHEFLGNKRGVQLELALARLRRLAPGLRCWGVSASLGNLHEAATVLAGPQARLIQSPLARRIEIRTLGLAPTEAGTPPAGTTLPWSGHLGLRMLPALLQAVRALADGCPQRRPSQLLFTNTRAQAELWFRALQAVWPWPPQELALHHGSLERTHREAVEQGLRDGALRLVVATSSLDLGVDFPAVDEVIQVGSPRSIARLLQRAGRSAHRPGMPARLLFLPTHALELIDIAAARDALAAGVVEPRAPLLQPLDVLAQHLLSLGLGGGFTASELLPELRSTHAYRTLSEAVLQELLLYLCQGGRSLSGYEHFRRLEQVDGRYLLRDRRQARRHRSSIGTITSDAEVEVRLRNGQRLGRVEESELARLTPGERFVLGGRSLSLVRLEGDRAIVRPDAKGPARTPRWMGGRLALSSQYAQFIADRLARWDDSAWHAGAAPATDPAAAEYRALAPLLQLQQSLSALPSPRHLLVERLRLRDGEHLFLYPLAGRDRHEVLAALLAQRLRSQWAAATGKELAIGFAVSDLGLVLVAPSLPAEPDWARLLAASADDGDSPAAGATADGGLQALQAQLARIANLSELARRQFRDIAQIAGLVVRGLPGQRRSLRQLQMSAGLLHDVLCEHEPDHLLLAQARDEALAQKLEPAAVLRLLAELGQRPLCLRQPARLTPFGFGLWAERLRARLGPEDWKSRIEAMAERLARAVEPA